MNIEKYREFIKSKSLTENDCGFNINESEINPLLFPFQNYIVRWALKKGKSLIAADTGLGKTAILLEWANHVTKKTNGKVLILSPLCVAQQTVKEGKKFGVNTEYKRNNWECKENIIVTNYEMMENFNSYDYIGVVLDEASIIKNQTGKIRNKIIEIYRNVPYKLLCTATPSPNDYMEIGNYSECLGVMTCQEMLSMFFTHDGGNTSKWRLKGHGKEIFWKWLATWSMFVKKPSDIGNYNDVGFKLPPVNIIEEIVKSDIIPEGELFSQPAIGLRETQRSQRESLAKRCNRVAEIVNNSTNQWVIWCNLNDESDLLCKLITDSKDVRGTQNIDLKSDRLLKFTNGELRVLITKGSITGYGMNWQHCYNTAYVGQNYSYEKYYQTLRRFYRFGQTNIVNVVICRSDREQSITNNLKEKEKKAEEMSSAMVKYMSSELHNNESTKHEITEYEEKISSGENWTLYQGDCVEILNKYIPDNTIHYSIFSPPFASLYTYSNSPRDMGNSGDNSEFYTHFEYIVSELYRVLMTGRLCSFHVMNIPTLKSRDGYIGITDFRGELIRIFIKAGFIFHSEVTIWKDPVTAMQRTKALGLLWKTIKKDSSMSRMGFPDYIITMRKPGDNSIPISHNEDEFPVDMWQKYASPIWTDDDIKSDENDPGSRYSKDPVWFGINQNDTLNRNEARSNEDERHICPLQLGVIDRCLRIWSNKGDTVLTPFAGIGSEMYQSLKNGRNTIGIELKPKYYDIAKKNCENAMKQLELF